MKICLVGPSYPFRGGIAHHTTLLYRHLRKRHNVEFYAFKRQYPRWMFPGTTDIDRSDIAIKENGAEYILDSLNPLSWWNVFRKIKGNNPDLVIFPWWVSFWTPQFFILSFLVKKFTRSKLLFICHNVVAHESKFLDDLCTRLVLRKGNYFIVHSDEDKKNLKNILPNACLQKVFHPLYDIFNLNKISKEKAQQQLRVEGNILLFFGFVRPYKGLKYLIEAMPLILERVNVTLLVVGEFWDSQEQYIKRIKELGVDTHVKIVDKYVPNEDVEIYFAACDVVILPYVSGTGSGIAQIAYGFNKPIIATNVGCLPEIVESGKTGFIVKAASPSELADAVVRFYEENKGTKFAQQIAREKKRFSWDKMVEVIDKLHSNRHIRCSSRS